MLYNKTIKKKAVKKAVKKKSCKIHKKQDLKKYKIMSYNVLAKESTNLYYKNHNFKINKNLIKYEHNNHNEHIEQTVQRYNKIKKEIEVQRPDIILLQEVDNYFFTFILKHLQDYDGYFNPFIPKINPDDLSIKHSTSILWKKNKFILNEEKKQKNLITYIKLSEKDNPEETLSLISVQLPFHMPNLNALTKEKKKLSSLR